METEATKPALFTLRNINHGRGVSAVAAEPTHANDTDSHLQFIAPDCDSQKHIYGS
jgi:hypothetical protein